MKDCTVIKAKDGCYYLIRYQSKGEIHPEDKGLWIADHVEWDWKSGSWMYNDDDVYVLTDEGDVVVREIGWNLRREKMR